MRAEPRCVPNHHYCSAPTKTFTYDLLRPKPLILAANL